MSKPESETSAANPEHKKILDVGCGQNKFPGAVGIDSNSRSHADVIHDLGKLCFAFTAFWGYLTFGQYLVIWYGNMGEETHWPRLPFVYCLNP